MADTEPSARIFEDPKAASALMDLSLLPLVAHFLRTESSASEAAQAVGADLDEAYYRVRKLARLGILEVTRTESRAGRPIKRYRASAQAFFVPFMILPQETLARALAESARVPDERRAEATARALLQMTDDPSEWGFRVFRDASGAVNAFWGPRESGAEWSVFDFLLGPDSPPVYGTNLTLSLTREQAKAMQHELHAFAEAWRTVSLRNRREGAGEPTREILFGTGMAPE